MLVQFAPDPSHRGRKSAEEAGGFDQVPVVEVSVCPWAAFPLMAGSTLFTGTPATTTIVAAERAALEAPAAFVAVTSTRIVEPTSPATSTYVFWFEPMFVQFAPDPSH